MNHSCAAQALGGADLAAPELISRDGVPCGIVRSTAYGHTLGRSIVTGYVDCPDGLPKITPKWLREGSWAVEEVVSAVTARDGAFARGSPDALVEHVTACNAM